VPAFLHSIGSILGEPQPIASIEPIARDAALLELLHANGLRDYRRADIEPPELAARAIAATLEISGVHPRQIAAVVWASTSFQDRAWYTTDISSRLGDLGLWTATTVGVTLAECGNLVPALRVASALAASEHRNVLLVATDRCFTPEQRLIAPSVSVLSDGAASCVVTSERRGYEMLALRHCTNHRARPENGAPSVRLLHQNAEGMRRVARAALADAGVRAEDITRLITNNLTRSVVDVFTAQCGVGGDRAYLDNVASHAHVFAADGLINLAASGARAGDTFLLATNGTCNWGAAVLRAVDDQRSSRCQSSSM
jgi:3-oxoacyl-[acyl-carrier-protein] synthase-3